MANRSEATSLDGRVIVVTGGARRIGRAIVRGFHSRGASVLVHYGRSSDEAEALAAELNATRTGSCETCQCDVTDTASLPAILAAAVERWGRLDGLVNNASTFYPTPLDGVDEASWDDLVGTNLKAPLFLSRAAAPHLRKTRGFILNMVDIHSRRPLPDHPVYCAAKAGLAMLTLSLARDLGPEVRVNGISPGTILWPEAQTSDKEKATTLARTPLGRIGDPDDIAGCALYLATADYVTGQVVAVDGGRSLGW